MPNSKSRDGKLNGLKIAILATDGVEQIELTKPRAAFEEAGAETVLISPKSGKIAAFNHHERGDKLGVDLTLDEANPDDYDALLLPGGALNPDALRQVPKAVAFVKAFAEAGKPIAAICHAPWLLVEADVVRGRRVTSWPSIKTDVKNAGGEWVDAPVVVDNGLVTSRKPADIPAFVDKAMEEFTEPQHRPN